MAIHGKIKERFYQTKNKRMFLPYPEKRSKMMSRVCELTRKTVMSGNKVSRSNNKTKRRFLPNLCRITLISDIMGQQYQLRISKHALRSVERQGGLDQFLLQSKKENLSDRTRLLRSQIIKKISEKSSEMIAQT